ncbi:hypothetical protein ACFXKG_30965 [Streptomyces sp. NPDC059255]
MTRSTVRSKVLSNPVSVRRVGCWKLTYQHHRERAVRDLWDALAS